MGIVKAVELLGRRLPFSITDVRGERLVHALDIRSVGTIVRRAQWAVGHWGMATLFGVAAKVSTTDLGVRVGATGRHCPGPWDGGFFAAPESAV